MQLFRKSKGEFLKLLLLFIAIAIPWILGVLLIREGSIMAERDIPSIIFSRDTSMKVNHGKFEILQQEFNSPHEVTEACLSCHNLTARDVMKSSHWTWDRDYVMEDGRTVKLGKKNMINNFCIGISSNESRCTSCHIGYGWKDNQFDFTDSRNIDCLVCHDKTGTYKKFPSGAGYPARTEKKLNGTTYYPPDYKAIANNVGTPGRENCGVCHFSGGGGNNVKHGDIANELLDVTREVDVHMAVDGANMTCTECHLTNRHNIAGNLYSIASNDKDRISCNQCHTSQPHHNRNLNRHVNRIACQTCHIPYYAKNSSTKMFWDWSTAGKLNEDGSYIVEYDSLGNTIYYTQKGSFQWANNVEPEYLWFNGEISHYVLGEKVDTTTPVQINALLGNYQDKGSKLFPVKVHRGRQIYDPVNKTMIQAHLFGKDSSAYWTTHDWNLAAEAGMRSVDLPYSGKYSFVSTEMYWPINHMVAPVQQSLECATCHSRDGRLVNLGGFYLSGRDNSRLLDSLGFILILLSFSGVSVHALIRIFKKS